MEYGMSTERTAEVLGIELIELDDWNVVGLLQVIVLINFFPGIAGSQPGYC